MLNPFVICSVEEQVALHAYADRERWQHECRSINPHITTEQLRTYDANAQCYAAATVYPNHVVIAYARRIVRDALARGEGMPVNVEQAIDDENRLRWRNLFSK